MASPFARSRMVACASGIGLWLAVLSHAEPPPPADALVFIRVIADIRVDFGGVREPIEREGMELATGSGFVVAPSGSS